MKPVAFWGALAAVLAAGLALTSVVANEYYYNALYVILQATMMAVAWNILGGFTGYVNFGSAGFFAMGAYTTVALDKALGLPLPLLIVIQPVEPSVGRQYIGRVFAIVVLGGMGSIQGMFIAALILGVVESMVATFVGPSWSPAVAFGVLALTLALRPAGLFGRR